MKTNAILTALATASAFALPASFAATATGLPVPAALAPLPMFGAFVVTFVLLSVSKEYGRHRIRFAGSTRVLSPAAAMPAKAEHPLAA